MERKVEERLCQHWIKRVSNQQELSRQSAVWVSFPSVWSEDPEESKWADNVERVCAP